MGASSTKAKAKDPEVEEIPEGQVPISPTDIPSNIPPEQRDVSTKSVSDIETKVDLSASANVDPSSVETATKKEEEEEDKEEESKEEEGKEGEKQNSESEVKKEEEEEN